MAEIVSFPARQESNAQAQVARDLVRSIGLTGLVRTATSPAHTRDAPAHTRAQVHTRDSGAREAAPRAGADNSASVIPLVPGSHAHEPHTPVPRSSATPAQTAHRDTGDFAFLGEPDRVLPVLPQLRELLPSRGLRRGSTIGAVGSAGATSLVIALLAEASRSGSWCAVVGMPTFGAAAAAEAGIALDRLALVPHPGPDWTTIVAALLDGVDIVVAAPPGPVAPAIANRLSARARQRGSVFVTYGQMPGADVVLDSRSSNWHGLDSGAGRLLQRELTIEVRGRGSAARKRSATVLMPAYAPMNSDWTPRTDWETRDQQSTGLTLVPTPADMDELLEVAS